MILWSGEIQHSLTQLVWPVKDCLNFPSEFHILTVLSEEQLIRKSSYLDNASFNTAPEWAFTDLFLPFLNNNINYTVFFHILISRSYPHENTLVACAFSNTSLTGPLCPTNLKGLICGLKLQT